MAKKMEIINTSKLKQNLKSITKQLEKLSYAHLNKDSREYVRVTPNAKRIMKLVNFGDLQGALISVKFALHNEKDFKLKNK